MESNLKEGKIGPIKRKFFIFFFVCFLFAIIQLNNQNNYSSLPKTPGGGFAPQIMPMFIRKIVRMIMKTVCENQMDYYKDNWRGQNG
jgi:hypothetical protein